MRILIGVAAMATGALAYADEFESVQKAVMGHEAFIVRCVDDKMASVDPEMFARDLANKSESEKEDYMVEVRGIFRQVCDEMYDGFNVCMTDGATSAIAEHQSFIAIIDDDLLNPTTRAENYKALLTIKSDYEREITALDDLRSGKTEYCNVAGLAE